MAARWAHMCVCVCFSCCVLCLLSTHTHTHTRQRLTATSPTRVRLRRVGCCESLAHTSHTCRRQSAGETQTSVLWCFLQKQPAMTSEPPGLLSEASTQKHLFKSQAMSQLLFLSLMILFPKAEVCKSGAAARLTCRADSAAQFA